MARPPALVRDRQAMASLLSDRMLGSYEALRAEQRLETETSLVKSYVVESTLRSGPSETELVTQAAALLAPSGLGRRVDLTIHRAEDPTLLNVEAELTVNQRVEHVVVYVDVSNPRYWLLHTMGGSTAVDYLVSRRNCRWP